MAHYNKKKDRRKKENKEGKELFYFDYDLLYVAMKDLLFDIQDTDAEVIFKIRDKNLDKIIKYLKPQTSGAKISPISPKNLAIGKGNNVYQYSNAQIEVYKKITNSLGKEDILFISRLNNKFLDKVIRRKTKNTLQDIKADMKLKQLKIKDYIYSEGYEKEYLEFLQKEIKEYEKSKICKKEY